MRLRKVTQSENNLINEINPMLNVSKKNNMLHHRKHYESSSELHNQFSDIFSKVRLFCAHSKVIYLQN